MSKEAKLRVLNVVLVVVLLGLVWVLGAPDARAHVIKKKQCREYARMHSVVLSPLKPQKVARKKAYRACSRAARIHILTHGLPLPPLLAAIRECESGGNYLAQNSSSTASGAFQYLDSTWGGHMGYSRAMYAPRRIQDRRAIRDFTNVGTRPWEASRSCWG
jgi:hypothetical protein